MRHGLLAAVATLSLAPAADAAEPARRTLEYAPAPVDNPLKGLVPYAGDGKNYFPHSLEFDYLPFSALVVGPDRYDWAPLERLLNAIAGRGNQAVIRIYLEYPAKTGVIPKFLIDAGLKVHKYVNTNTAPLPPENVETPDYADPRLRTALRQFVAAFGRKYDGDPRLGFVTAGLLGTWGEWHTYPREDLFPSKEVQAEVMDAYEAAFRRTPVLLRYPAGGGNPTYAANDRRPFGYHDDSFAWATLATGKDADDWHYMATLADAGPDALAKWKTRPIGGEIRPELWGKIFDAKPTNPKAQDFRRCVETTHATWLMDSGMFRPKQPKARIARAEDEVRRMGYEFHAAAVALSADGGKLRVALEIENRGVAPFYSDWRPEFAVITAKGGIVSKGAGDGKLTGILPGERHTWNDALAIDELTAGKYGVLVRVPNPLQNGKPLRFANKEQDREVATWLTLGTFDKP